MNWGHKIVIAFILFGALIITLVVVSVRTDFHLVSADYYQRTLEFESHMSKAKNAQELSVQPELLYSSNPRKLELVFSKEVSQSIKEGNVTFFRPSNGNMDFNTELMLDINGRQTVDLVGRREGLWKVKLSWKDSQKEYYMEQRIYL